MNVTGGAQQQDDKAYALGIRSKGDEGEDNDSADVNGEANGGTSADVEERSPENREDIRYGYSFLFFALIGLFLCFTVLHCPRGIGHGHSLSPGVIFGCL